MRILFLFVLAACACGSDLPANEAPEKTVDAAMMATLEKADLADHTQDKVVHRCAGCALMMDGNEAHTIEVEGYALHMCSAQCKMNFEKDIPGNLAKLPN
jgi:hypothetical protein